MSGGPRQKLFISMSETPLPRIPRIRSVQFEFRDGEKPGAVVFVPKFKLRQYPRIRRLSGFGLFLLHWPPPGFTPAWSCMKVAFDGTVLQGRKSGVGYYCEELLRAMAAVSQAHRFVVFSHQRLQLDFVSGSGNVELRDAFRFPVRAVYLHALLPRILDGIRPDLCHYTNFLAPIFEQRPYVVTIHDMGMAVLQESTRFPNASTPSAWFRT